MAEKKKGKSGLISHGIAAQNRKARFDYSVKETVEAGIVLKGPEVKSLRHGRATLTEAWAGEREGELWLFNCYIPEYQGGVLSRFEPRAPRKLLLHRKQVSNLLGEISRQGATIVPLDIHFNERGRAKVLLGVAAGPHACGQAARDRRPRLEARQGAADAGSRMSARGVGGAAARDMSDEPEIPANREKFVARKQEWAREGRLLTGTTGDPARDRLPPGQRLVQRLAGARSRRRAQRDGSALPARRGRPRAPPAQPRSRGLHGLAAGEGGQRHPLRHAMVALRQSLAGRVVAHAARCGRAARRKRAHVVFHSYDGYTTNVRLDQFAAPGVLLVHAWEGKPLTREHGGPVRVVIPSLYFWKSAKWIRRIELVGQDRPGFWEMRGYHNNADPWREERYTPEPPPARC